MTFFRLYYKSFGNNNEAHRFLFVVLVSFAFEMGYTTDHVGSKKMLFNVWVEKGEMHTIALNCSWKDVCHKFIEFQIFNGFLKYLLCKQWFAVHWGGINSATDLIYILNAI